MKTLSMIIKTFNTLPSTNDYLINLSKKNAISWTVIRAIDQTNGRGSAENKWETHKNDNLTFSFSLVNELEFKDNIFLSKWVANVIRFFLSFYLSDIYIKWPNDIIIHDKKIGGILIESFKKDGKMCSIIGIGLNLNQTNFENLPKATSLFNETDKKTDIYEFMTRLISLFQKKYIQIENREWENIDRDYHQYLYKKDELANFYLPIEKKEVKGLIKKALVDGRLEVEVGGQSKYFQYKEIQLLF